MHRFRMTWTACYVCIDDKGTISRRVVTKAVVADISIFYTNVISFRAVASIRIWMIFIVPFHGDPPMLVAIRLLVKTLLLISFGFQDAA